MGILISLIAYYQPGRKKLNSSHGNNFCSLNKPKLNQCPGIDKGLELKQETILALLGLYVLYIALTFSWLDVIVWELFCIGQSQIPSPGIPQAFDVFNFSVAVGEDGWWRE